LTAPPPPPLLLLLLLLLRIIINGKNTFVVPRSSVVCSKSRIIRNTTARGERTYLKAKFLSLSFLQTRRLD